MKKSLFSFSFLLLGLTGFSQPTQLELGIKRNTAQTLMGTAKIDSYKKNKTIYTFPDSVFFTIEFDEEEKCTGFFWSGKNESVLNKTIEQNGFAKRDNETFSAKNFPGVLKKGTVDSETIFRFVPAPQAAVQEEKKPVQLPEEVPKEKPFYGFTILGMKVWEKESH